MEWMRIARHAAVSASALVLGACTTVVNIPASEVPELAPATRPEPVEWATVHTTDGKTETLKGTIDDVRIWVRGGSTPVYLPMNAQIAGDVLTIRDQVGSKAFRMQDVERVQVEYFDREKAYKMPGGTLLGLSSPFVVTGVALLVSGASSQSDFSGLMAVYGLFIGGIGLGIAIPGIVLVAIDPKPPGARSARLHPKIDVTPGGMRFSTAF
ncbi:hypothetical protein [Polyangium aurulentum]|uniref:hypothetical protein n=1 Tax=Polyangium aurulentum TaxID=2567896 RepID=UPI0010AE422F|nr:hypothetical protein [Polyangium aurulentum]UQA55102.1 hypothetical protein E8A73_027545 [Polyangium aurulentum]